MNTRTFLKLATGTAIASACHPLPATPVPGNPDPLFPEAWFKASDRLPLLHPFTATARPPADGERWYALAPPRFINVPQLHGYQGARYVVIVTCHERLVSEAEMCNRVSIIYTPLRRLDGGFDYQATINPPTPAREWRIKRSVFYSEYFDPATSGTQNLLCLVPQIEASIAKHEATYV